MFTIVRRATPVAQERTPTGVIRRPPGAHASPRLWSSEASSEALLCFGFAAVRQHEKAKEAQAISTGIAESPNR